MLEKDIENLLVRYPGEFLPKYGFIVKGQQVKLGSDYADIVFEDSKGDLVIVEVKRGILDREALGQVIVYYGLLRKKEPNKNIRLMLVANVIPESMKAFPDEKLGVEFQEISISKIMSVASKYSYQFLDSEKPELLQTYKQVIQRMDVEAETAQRRVWIFQANPRRYDILNALADESLTEKVWLVNRYRKQIHAGHIGLIWMSGKEGGIYAVVDITSDPQMLFDSEQSRKYWVDTRDRRQLRWRVKMRYRLKFVNNPIFREELKGFPGLEKMPIFRQPQATNFPVSNDEWQVILNILKKKFGFKE